MDTHRVWITAPDEDYEAIARRLGKILIPGDTVLFKASRAMRLETLIMATEKYMKD